MPDCKFEFDEPSAILLIEATYTLIMYIVYILRSALQLRLSTYIKNEQHPAKQTKIKMKILYRGGSSGYATGLNLLRLWINGVLCLHLHRHVSRIHFGTAKVWLAI